MGAGVSKGLPMRPERRDATSMHPFVTQPVPEGRIAIHWFGQSSFAVKNAGGEIALVDPFFTRIRPEGKYIYDDPPADEAAWPVNYIILTHDHRDHTSEDTLERFHAHWPSIRYVGPVESIRRVRSLGVPEAQVTIVDAGDRVPLGSMTLYAVYAKPPGGLPEYGIEPPDVTHLGYVLDVSGFRIYFSGDPVRPFDEIDELVRPIAVLKPEIGMFTTHPTEGEFPFFEGSVRMAERIGVKVAIPSHYGYYRKRTYDPHEWAACFSPGGPTPLIIPYNSSILYPDVLTEENRDGATGDGGAAHGDR